MIRWWWWWRCEEEEEEEEEEEAAAVERVIAQIVRVDQVYLHILVDSG